MKLFYRSIFLVATLFVMHSCTTYEPKEYGPVDFELLIEGPVFEGSVADGITTIAFKPEDFGINRDDIYSMKVKEIKITTDYEGGLGAFENIVFTIMTDDTETKEVASIKIEGNPSELTLKGLEEAEIKGFSKIDEFYLEIMGITKEEGYDDIIIKGSLVMNVMVPE